MNKTLTNTQELIIMDKILRMEPYTYDKLLKNITLPFKLIKSINTCKKILKKYKPQVIFSKGGFVSLPVCIAGKLLNLPVVSHESDLTLGLANKIIYHCCTTFCTTFESTSKNLKLNDTLFIVTADHGGNGKSHGGLTDGEKYVMFAAAGKTVQQGTIEDMEIRDTAAVVLYALGYESHENWTARVPSGLFEGVVAGERPVYVNKDSERYHENEMTPEKESDGYVTNFVDNELKAYLTFDGDVTDNQGGSTEENGKLYYVEGYYGQGAAFDDGYVTLNGCTLGKDSFTVAFWINTQGVSSDPCIISNKNWDSGKNSGLTIAINGSDNDIRLNLGNGGTRADCNVSLPSNYREGWMHIIAVVDRERNKLGICIDFETYVEVDIPSGLWETSFDTSYPLNIGQDGRGTYNAKLSATLDELMIFDGAFGESDIQALASYFGITD